MSIGSDPEFAARPQLSEDVARYVRRRIFNGTYRAGEYLRLDQLAVELGISVTPVREALLNLRAEGLLVQQPRRGFMVLAVTARDIADVAERAGLHRRRARGACGREHHRRAAWRPAGDPGRARAGVRAGRPRAHRAAQPRIPPHHQRRRGFAQADPVHVGHHPLRARSRCSRRCSGWPKQSTRDHRRVIAAFEAPRRRTGPGWRWPSTSPIGVAPLTDHLIERGVIGPGGWRMPR